MPCATKAPGAREVLRTGTHAEHVRLNHHRLLRGITQPDYPLTRYQLVLQLYAGFYRDFEAAVDAYLQTRPLLFDYASRRKLPWLLRDLQHYGLLPGAASAGIPAALQISSDAQLAGALYTIEGSTLGGQLIARHIGTRLGITAERGGRFFHGYGDATMPLWLQCESFMNRVLVDDAGLNTACLQARNVFLHLEQTLNDHPTSPTGQH